MSAIQAIVAIVLLVFLGIVFGQVMGQAYTVAQQANDIQAVNFIGQAKNMGYTLLLLMFGIDAVVILAVMRLLASNDR
jgi:hypothetical protein